MGAPLNNIDDRDKKYWYVMIAYKQEEKAEKALSAPDGLEFYIAKHYIIRTIHGKKERLLIPSISNILFVHASWTEIVNFKRMHPFLKFSTRITRSGIEYLIVPERQMMDFIRISSDREKNIRYYSPSEINFQKGQQVRVVGGEFDGVEGTFVKVSGRRSRQLVVLIPNLMAASVEIRPEYLELLQE